METKLKFKVGDKVRVKSLEWYNSQEKNERGTIEEGASFTKEMSALCGSVLTIDDKGNYLYVVYENGYYWQDWMLEDEPVNAKQEFDNMLNLIEKRYDEAKKQLYIDYAIANNPCEIGDIIEDHIGKGKIIRQRVVQNYFDRYASMLYECIELDNNCKHKKKEIVRQIYQSNIKEINGKPYKYDE